MRQKKIEGGEKHIRTIITLQGERQHGIFIT